MAHLLEAVARPGLPGLHQATNPSHEPSAVDATPHHSHPTHHGLISSQHRLQRAAPVQAPARLCVAHHVAAALGALHHRAAHACECAREARKRSHAQCFLPPLATHTEPSQASAHPCSQLFNQAATNGSPRFIVCPPTREAEIHVFNQQGEGTAARRRQRRLRHDALGLQGEAAQVDLNRV